MKKLLIKRSIIIGIIILFLGASFLPGISGDKNIVKKDIIEKEITINKSDYNTLFFTENVGQFHENVLFKICSSEATVYLCKNEIVTVFTKPTENQNEFEIQSIVTKFVNSNLDTIVKGLGLLPNYNNYYLGDNQDKWFSNVKNFEKVFYKNIYNGIDLVYYIDSNSLKYDFIVNPDADFSDIKICYEGIENLFLNSKEGVQIDFELGKIVENKPFIYQKVNGINKEINGNFKIIDGNTFGFKIDNNYDPSIPFIIDPTMVYSTFLGGNNYDIGKEVDIDSNGYAYIVGGTESNNFPTQNPYQGTYMGLTDAFVSKISPSGNSLFYSTYFGGTSHDYGESIDVDSNGNACIAGTTYSSDFPTANALFPNLHGIQDAFVARFTSNGGIIYSTYLGGSNWEWGIDVKVDSVGIAYVTGFTDSSDFPTINPYDNSWNGLFDFFISKIDPPGGFLMYSTYLGGSDSDVGCGIDIDNQGNAYVTGYSWSTNFPVTGNAYDSSYNGNADIVVAILDTVTGGSGSLSYGSYIFGQGDDFGYDLAVDSNNIMYVTGETGSTVPQFFPVTSNAYQQFLNGNRDAFVFQLDTSLPPASQMLYCSYLGGMTGGIGADAGRSIDLIGNNLPYISGATECNDFPLVNPLGSYNGLLDAFASLFDTSQSGTSSLIDSTYIGGSNHDEAYGIAVDANNDVYVTGLTYSTDYPVLNPYQGSNNGMGDAFVTKLTPSGINNPPNQPNKPTGPVSGKPGVSYPYQTSTVDIDGDKIRYGWDWNGDGTVDQWDDNGGSYYNSGIPITTTHSWTAKGTYQISVMAEDIHGAGGVWSSPLSVTIPKNKVKNDITIYLILECLFERFPLIKQILGL